MLKYYKVVLILFIFASTTGCQQTYRTGSMDQTMLSSTAAPTDLQPSQVPETPEPNNRETIGATQELDGGEGSAAIQESDTVQVTTISDSELPATTESMESEVVTSNVGKSSDITAQEKIDQALELCNYAQQMWETGKLEEALANLDAAYGSIIEINGDETPEFNQQKEDIRYLISKRILEIYASRQIVINGQHDEIPITLNTHVQREIKKLTGPERQFFIQSLERAAQYRPFIVSELRKAGLPEDISWLPLIESGFKIRALSPARALGLWQFIPSTGYKFGLNRNYYIDERLDPEKSTRAAIAYLKELHNLFGDWTTALAAYNCGESRVLRIIRKQRINYLDNFWDLYQNLPRETSRYVPRFLATLHIVNNLDDYKIEIKNPLSPVEYKFCEIKKQVRLKDIAKEIQVDTKILKELNAELRYALLPPESYQLKIPEEKAGLFLSKIDKIKTSYSPPPMYVFHRVRKGETLSGIAEKYKTSVRAISSANNINRAHRIFAGKVLKIPGRSTGAHMTASTAPGVTPGQAVTYIVMRGDNLWNIAGKFGTTTKTIMAENNLSGTNLSIGQTLRITSRKKSKVEQIKIAKKNTYSYQVQSGDSPFSIAKKYKMSLNRLLALNHLNKTSKIFPGQKLILE